MSEVSKKVNRFFKAATKSEVLHVQEEVCLDDNYERICEDNMTVGEFAHYNPIGTYLITMLGHITTIKDGEIIDTFDCSDRIMWCAWCVE